MQIIDISITVLTYTYFVQTLFPRLFCGGYKSPPSKILMGGPMMGRAIFSDSMPIVKNNNAILVFSKAEKRKQAALEAAAAKKAAAEKAAADKA